MNFVNYNGILILLVITLTLIHQCFAALGVYHSSIFYLTDTSDGSNSGPYQVLPVSVVPVTL